MEFRNQHLWWCGFSISLIGKQVINERELQRDEIILIWTIDRSEVITNVYYHENEALVLEWSGAALNTYIEFSPELPSTSWQEIDGPVVGFSWTNSEPSLPGVYRLRSE